MTLMLSPRCNTEEIERVGVEALSGVDRERFLELKSVNDFLPQDKQLLFYIARLEYRIMFPRHCFTSRPKKEVTLGQISWYSLSGKMFGKGGSEEWTRSLNLLNSGNDTLGRHENLSTSSVGNHTRFGVVAWPSCADITNRHTHMGEIAATFSILSDGSGVTDRIRRFLLFDVETYQPKAPCVPMALLCQKLWKVIAETEELPLVEVFFNWYFKRLESKLDFIPDIVSFVQRGDCDGAVNLFIDAMKQLGQGMRLALRLCEALSEYPQARVTLTTFALQEARFTVEFSDRCISEEVGMLWTEAMDCNNDRVCTDLLKIVAQVDGSLLSPYVNQLSKLISSSSLPEHRDAFTGVVDKRRQWLREQVSNGAPPHWEISDEHFPDAANITTFLRGPLVSLVIEGFNSIGAARTRAALLRKRIKGPLDVSARKRGAEAYVQLTKQDTNLKASCTMEIAKMDLLLQDLSSPVGDENADRSNSNTTLA